jgi:hypothetical protein
MNFSSNQVSSVNAVDDFIVVVSNEDDYHSGYHHFSEKINRKLQAGYQLHGQPFTVNHAMCQAMVRPAGVEPSGDTTVFFHKQTTGHAI